MLDQKCFVLVKLHFIFEMFPTEHPFFLDKNTLAKVLAFRHNAYNTLQQKRFLKQNFLWTIFYHNFNFLLCFSDYHVLFLFPNSKDETLRTSRFVDSTPPTWSKIFKSAELLYPKKKNSSRIPRSEVDQNITFENSTDGKKW